MTRPPLLCVVVAFSEVWVAVAAAQAARTVEKRIEFTAVSLLVTNE